MHGQRPDFSKIFPTELQRAAADYSPIGRVFINTEIPNMIIQLTQGPGKQLFLFTILLQQLMNHFDVFDGGFTNHAYFPLR
jgi:hypothetical protein